MKKIKNLILDYGNVLFEIDFKRAQDALSALGVRDIETFFSHKSHHNIFNDFEVGKISAKAFRDEIRAAASNPKLTDQQIDDAWNSLLIGVPDASIHDLLLELKSKYRLFLLSNNNEIHYEWIIKYLMEKWNIPNYDAHFENAYFSHIMMLRKPNLDIFEYVVRAHDLDPEETLFVDDSPQHLEGAKKIGFQTLLMDKKPIHLRSVLEENGVL